MLTSIRVWAIIIPNFTDCWCFYTFMILFPSYLKDAQNLDITTVRYIPYHTIMHIISVATSVIQPREFLTISEIKMVIIKLTSNSFRFLFVISDWVG